MLALAAERYAGFGPTPLGEYLTRDHDAVVSVKTLRQWLIQAGHWETRAQRHTVHRARGRRPRSGELIQIDGSPHGWLEGRGPRCAMIVFIDDARNQVRTVFCDNPASRTISRTDSASRKCIRQILPTMNMVTTPKTPPRKRSRVGRTPGSNLDRQNLQKRVNFQSAATNPQQNASIERYNRTVRYAWPAQTLSATIEQVQEAATRWLWAYNHERPNMALGGITSSRSWPLPHSPTSDDHQKWGDYPPAFVRTVARLPCACVESKRTEMPRHD